MTVTPLTTEDLYDVVFDFVHLFAAPQLEEDHIFRGWGNRMALPADSQDYAVISVLSTVRHGTNLNRLNVDEETQKGTMMVSELLEAEVQLDFCSTGEDAQRRAQCMEILARDPAGVDFFRHRSVGCLYATDARDISFIGDDTQFNRRWTVSLHLTYWAQAEVPVPWFDAVNVRLENVDVHHKPVQ